MATNNPHNNPDLLYYQSRDSLLQYEDAKFNSLIQALANFYSTRNDQSIWGNFIRALAQELGRIDFGYNYDIVGKNPSFLTPPDIRRRWAAPLFISSNWPSPQQTDIQYKQMLVDLLAAYKEGTTTKAIHDVILAYTGISINVVELYKQIGNGIFDQSDRNAISVSVAVGNAGSNPLTTVTSLLQLQTIVQSLYNAIALAKPAHVGLEFTTIFGEAEGLECILSPQIVTQQQIVQLPQNQQTFYTFLNYAPINPASPWRAHTAFVLGNIVRDVHGNFQLVTSIGAPPNQSGATQPSWSLVGATLDINGHLVGATTPDGQLTWTNISPAVVSTSVSGNVVTVHLAFPSGLSVGNKITLTNLGNSTFLNGVPLTITTVSGSSFTAAFTHANYTTVTETNGTATFAFPNPITALQWQALNTTWQALFQRVYANTNCQSTGITDTLRIFVKQIEAPPFGPMLIQAPVFDPKNPKTTIAAYGRILAPKLTPTQWGNLPRVFVNIINAIGDGVNITYSYVPTTQFLHEGEMVSITGFSTAALNLTSPVKDVFNQVANILGTSITSNVLTVRAPNTFVAGMLVTFQNTAESFLNGQSFVITAATPTSFTASFTHPNYSNPSDSGTAEVSTFQIASSAVVALETPAVQANAGILTPTLQSAYYLSNGMYVLGLPPIGTSITPPAGQPYSGTSWIPNGNVFQGQIIVDTNGDTQLALNNGISGPTLPAWNPAGKQSVTPEGTVRWRNVGRNAFSASTNWVQILNMETNNPTGEVGNWDAAHQYGLLAPRLDQVWEISGGDQDFIFGLF